MFASKEWTKSLLNKCFAKRDSYSTSEQKIGTWIDGKTLYRRVFTSSTGASVNTANSVLGLSSYGITNSKIKKIEWFTTGSEGNFYPDGNSTATYRLWVDGSSNLQEIHTGTALNSLPLTVIIEYTK